MIWDSENYIVAECGIRKVHEMEESIKVSWSQVYLSCYKDNREKLTSREKESVKLHEEGMITILLNQPQVNTQICR